MESSDRKFKLLKLLGSGGFAHTWLAEVLDGRLSRKWGREVVLKIPLSKDKEFILINELIQNAVINQSLQGINAPNIVKYLGFNQYDKQYVMVMEYVEGDDLRKKIGPVGEQRILPVIEALEITKQVCYGLIQMHESHMYHRDIKPENILITKEDRIAKILDLGIAKMIQSTELASTTTGTIYYMPREILRGEGGSFYSDIYSLGVTMYEMLTGELPFNGSAIAIIVDNICSKEPVNPCTYNKSIDPTLCKIILKAMAKDPSNRYRTAKELLEAITKFEGGVDEEDEIVEKCKKEADELYFSDNQKEAKKILLDLVKKYPDNPKSYLGLGVFYNRCEQFKQAISTFQEGIRINPNFALLYLNLALSFSKMGNNTEALKNLNKAINLGLEKNQEDHAKRLLEIWGHK